MRVPHSGRPNGSVSRRLKRDVSQVVVRDAFGRVTHRQKKTVFRSNRPRKRIFRTEISAGNPADEPCALVGNTVEEHEGKIQQDERKTYKMANTYLCVQAEAVLTYYWEVHYTLEIKKGWTVRSGAWIIVYTFNGNMKTIIFLFRSAVYGILELNNSPVLEF